MTWRKKTRETRPWDFPRVEDLTSLFWGRIRDSSCVLRSRASRTDDAAVIQNSVCIRRGMTNEIDREFVMDGRTPPRQMMVVNSFLVRRALSACCFHKRATLHSLFRGASINWGGRTNERTFFGMFSEHDNREKDRCSPAMIGRLTHSPTDKQTD